MTPLWFNRLFWRDVFLEWSDVLSECKCAFAPVWVQNEACEVGRVPEEEVPCARVLKLGTKDQIVERRRAKVTFIPPA